MMNFARTDTVTPLEKMTEELAMQHLLDVSLVTMNEKKNADRYANRPKSIGAGRVGHPLAAKPYDRGCERQLWYEWKQYPSERPFEANLYRTFSFGHAAEPIVVENLRAAGFVVLTHKTGPDGQPTDEQFGFGIAFDANGNAQYKGFYDGVIIDGPAEWKSPTGDVVQLKYPMLWENKSANNKKFNLFVANGVEISHPVYYGQIQSYLNFSQLYANPALLTMINKDTGELRVEFVRFNLRHCQAILERVSRILAARGPLMLERPVPEYEMVPCKWCPYLAQCQKDELNRPQVALPGAIEQQAPGWLKRE